MQRPDVMPVCPVCYSPVWQKKLEFLPCCGYAKYLCQECVGQVNRCPFCNASDLQSKVAETKAATKQTLSTLLQGNMFACESCSQEMRFCEFQAHLCPNDVIACDMSGCSAKPMRKDLQKHKDTECRFALLPCEHCKQTVLRSE